MFVRITLLVMLLSVYSIPGSAQLLNRIKNTVEGKIGDKIDESIDKATGKKKSSKNESAKTSGGQGNTSTEISSKPEIANTKEQTSSAPTSAGDLTAYSKFDFVMGSKIIAHEDFMGDEIGDFPAKWNTQSGAEVVTVDNHKGKWLRMSQEGVFYPEYLTSDLPDNFTLQMDVMANKQVSNIGKFMISFIQAGKTDEIFERGISEKLATPGFKIAFSPLSSKGMLQYASNLIKPQYKYGVPEFNVDKNTVKVSIWKQKQRVRVYLDSTKILDLPRALEASEALNTLVFTSINPDFNQKGGAFFLSNIQLAVGSADTRNKLVTEGKFITHGIHFGVNSDQIQPQSYGSLKEIAQVLQENAGLRVRIVGHTDGDGSDEVNNDLSKRRALAVRQSLTTTFSIDASRLESDGKGKTQPIDANDTAVGKANNRRVEFIRL